MCSGRIIRGPVGHDITERLKAKELGDWLEREYIYSTGWKMLGVTVTGVLATVAVAWLSARTGSLVAVRMRRDLYKQVLSFSAADIDQFSTSSLITRTTNDVLQIQYLILLGMRLLLFAPVIGLGGVVFALRSSISLSWIIAVAVLCVTGLLLIVFSLTVPKSKLLQQLIDNVNRISRENLTGMMVIRAFGNERYEESRFEDASNELRRTNRFIQRAMAFMFPVLTLIMNATMLVILWFGAGAIAASELQIGSMMAFMQYAMLIIMSFLLMSMMFTMVPRALAAAERIQEVLGTESVIRGQETGKRHANDEQMTIEFREVSFRYADTEADILQDISFTARPGEVTAIIGATGSGKSSLVHLLPRFYDVTKGQILINGIDIRDLPLEKLRGWIGYVPQRSVLFSGDIASNVRFGHPSASDAEVEEALDIAQASEFVRKLEYGIQSPISQGGTNVSGGQRQRIAIARALIKRSPIYIFDDSFSALDLKTDAALRKSLQRVTSEATVIIVAQRISTIRNAAQIMMILADHHNRMFFYLDDGRFIGIIAGNKGDQWDLESLTAASHRYISSCNQYFYCDLSCYWGMPVQPHMMSSMVERLRTQDNNNVAFFNQVYLYCEDGNMHQQVQLPDLDIWTNLLKTEDRNEIIVSVEKLFDRLTSSGYLNADLLHQIQQDYLQALYSYLNQKGIQAHQLFGDEMSKRVAAAANRSVADMLSWVKYSVERAINQSEVVDKAFTLVETVKQYIARNIDRDLSRELIASIAYLNPDHLSRIFKKHTGYAISEYVLMERVKLAKKLLVTTDIPIGAIATSVGYSNFSHFARMFKKYAEMGPSEYRQKYKMEGVK